jgi:hypothetical protein
MDLTADFNAPLRHTRKTRGYHASDRDRQAPGRLRLAALHADQIHGIRSLRAELFKRWREVPPGEILSLTFN